jgi:hypothetical protein
MGETCKCRHETRGAHWVLVIGQTASRENLDTDMIILKNNIKEQDRMAHKRFIWLRTGTRTRHNKHSNETSHSTKHRKCFH